MSDNIARILALAAIGAGSGGGGGGALTPIVVYELPDVGEEGVLYLVPRQVTETKNVFDEYIYVNGGWEKIGSTDIDFSDYYTKQEVDAIAATLNTGIGQRYLKPSGGIPDTDLSSGVQADLNKAKTALQTENDPVFGASAAAEITSSDITSWNNKLSSETDPVFSASPAAGITSTNITSWSGKQDALVSGTNIKTINNTSILGSGDLSTRKQSLIVDAAPEGWNYIIDSEDVDIILGKVENQEDFDLFIRVQAGEDTYTTPAHIDVYSTSGNDYIQMICNTISSAWTRWATFYGELIEGSDCTLVEHRIENANNKVTSITGSESYAAYPTTVAVTDFVNSKFLSKTNTNSYTPTSNYHPATKKYVDDKASDYLAKNNTTAFTPTGDYQPATKKYVDDNSGGDLSNYLAKNNTTSFTPSGNYNPATKKYVDDTVSTAISNLDITDREIVQQLPTQNISTKTIYMVPKTTPGSQNAYTEYMYINNAWEKIGDTEIDLSDYATKDYVDEKVPAFFDGSKSEWDTLTQEQQKNILFAAVNDFELNSEEEAILLGVLGDKTGIDTDTELEETLNAFLNIAGENE